MSLFQFKVLSSYLTQNAPNKLKSHPNSPTIDSIELLIYPDETYGLTLHGGHVNKSDYSEMGQFWDEFTSMMAKIGVKVSYSSG